MTPKTLNPNRAEADLVCYLQKDGAIEIELRAHQHSSPCPSCGQHSSRVHSRYRRTIADLPWAGLPACILLQARRFFCVDERCSRRIFTERLPGTVEQVCATKQPHEASTHVGQSGTWRSSKCTVGRQAWFASEQSNATPDPSRTKPSRHEFIPASTRDRRVGLEEGASIRDDPLRSGGRASEHKRVGWSRSRG